MNTTWHTPSGPTWGEVEPYNGKRPYSGDSFLPEHLVAQARAAVDRAEAALQDRCKLDRQAEQPSGAWKNLRCDVCGTTFDGFHTLNAARDRCCPTCARRQSIERAAGMVLS